jgi:xanthine/uracil/vitamin C permease (AzgA family)
VTLGNLHAHSTQLAIFGIVLIAVLQAYRVKASMLIGVLTTLALGILLHQVKYTPSTFNPMAIRDTAFPSRHSRRAEDECAGDHLRVPVRRPVRQHRNAGGGDRARRPDR